MMIAPSVTWFWYNCRLRWNYRRHRKEDWEESCQKEKACQESCSEFPPLFLIHCQETIKHTFNGQITVSRHVFHAFFWPIQIISVVCSFAGLSVFLFIMCCLVQVIHVSLETTLCNMCISILHIYVHDHQALHWF